MEIGFFSRDSSSGAIVDIWTTDVGGIDEGDGEERRYLKY